MSQIINFFEDYKSSKKIEGKLLYNHSLAKSSWLGVGGAAEVFYLCESFSQLSDILRKCPKKINLTGSVVKNAMERVKKDKGFERKFDSII